MPPLRIHTHCQVAQKSQRTDQNLSKSMAAQTHGQTEEIKHENTTMCIVHKGFRGFRAVSLAWFLGGNVTGLKLEIPYAPYTNRCAPLEKRASAQSKDCFTHIAFFANARLK
jgi:hypothetical protein